jgi:tetratricopeptide (TPR) repeat protein
MSKRPTSYTELVYNVLREADEPLTIELIMDRVNERRAITTKKPRNTIRGVLSQGRQIIRVEQGLYWYLPHLLPGSVLRIPLRGANVDQQPLALPSEVMYALWPSFHEGRARRNLRPVQARFPGREVASLSLDLLAIGGNWGSPMPDPLRSSLSDLAATEGDSIVFLIVDGEAGTIDAWYEPRHARNEDMIATRNREIADTVAEILSEGERHGVAPWRLCNLLLARGAYRSDVPPDPLSDVLERDERFVGGGMMFWDLAERLDTEDLAEMKVRQQLLDAMFNPPDEPVDLSDAAGLIRAVENVFINLSAKIANDEVTTTEDAAAFLRDRLQLGSPEQGSGTALEQAQDLMYDAWQERNPTKRIATAEKALRISPDCADAYVLLATETKESAAEAIPMLRDGVAAGERALGPGAFIHDVGLFWGLIETRPYMRARFELARALWNVGERQEATEHAFELLRLNPGDNQGVRHTLVNWLLENGADKQARQLIGDYPDDDFAVMRYARALLEFRSKGDGRQARKQLDSALAANPFVPDYLLGNQPMPDILPAYMGFGDEREAIVCVVLQLTAWEQTPGALDWLRDRTDPAR